MTNETNDLITSVLESLSSIDYIKPEQIPAIPLYMDQVTTFIDEQLKSSKRYEEDKILTKTMINNYAKNNLLPAPDKKKYSKEHILVLVFIYYFKNILSIKDIEKLMSPITSQYFTGDNTLDLSDIYNEVLGMERERINILKEDILQEFKNSKESFPEEEDENREFLQLFSFICVLSLDVYFKKQIIEKLIDELPDVDKKTKKAPPKK